MKYFFSSRIISQVIRVYVCELLFAARFETRHISHTFFAIKSLQIMHGRVDSTSKGGNVIASLHDREQAFYDVEELLKMMMK